MLNSLYFLECLQIQVKPKALVRSFKVFEKQPTRSVAYVPSEIYYLSLFISGLFEYLFSRIKKLLIEYTSFCNFIGV